MTEKILAVLPGDGIGPEVTAAALNVLEAVAQRGGITVDIRYGVIGGQAIDEQGHPFPEATRALVDGASAVLLGAVGGPKWDAAPVRPEAGLLQLRKHMGVFANLRPFEVFPGLEAFSPLKTPKVRGLIIRELTGGLYFGEPRGRHGEGGDETAIDTLVYRRSEIERLAVIGFEYAARHNLPLVSIDKANVLESSRLWRQTVTALQTRYPAVPLYHRYVDAAAMEMVLKPWQYPVVITENLFGDILSDLAGGLVGSLGLLGSASVKGPPGAPGLFEPVHGSAPDIAGQGRANPVGAILSVASLLAWSWSRPDLERMTVEAVRATLAAGQRTVDLGGTLDTDAFTAEVIKRLGTVHEGRETQ